MERVQKRRLEEEPSRSRLLHTRRQPDRSKDFGTLRTRGGFGEGTSPALFGDTVVVQWDSEDESFLVALDKATGEERWRKRRDEVTSWATPLLVPHAGRVQVITTGERRVNGYDLESGEVIWEADGLTLNAIPSPVEHDGVVYVTSGFRGNAARRFDSPMQEATSRAHRRPSCGSSTGTRLTSRHRSSTRGSCIS